MNIPGIERTEKIKDLAKTLSARQIARQMRMRLSVVNKILEDNADETGFVEMNCCPITGFTNNDTVSFHRQGLRTHKILL